MIPPQDPAPASDGTVRRARRAGRAAVVLSVAGMALFGAVTASAATTGVHADGATVTADGKYLDVFATSSGSRLQVDGSPATAMAHDAGSTRFYARVALTGAAPASVTVRNLSDSPQSTSTVSTKAPSGITITKAEYDSNGRLTVGAVSGKGEALTATGLGPITNPSGTVFAIAAPPYTVTVTGASGSESAPVVITGGGSTTPTSPTSTSSPTTTSSATPTTTTSPSTSTGAPTSTSTSTSTSTAPTSTVPTTTTAPPVTTAPVDTVVVTDARHRLFQDFRVEGTDSSPGATVTVVDNTPVGGVPRKTVLGTAAVGSTGGWELRLRPGPSTQVTSVLVQSSRGGSATAAVSSR